MKNGATYFKYGSLLAIVIILVWFLNDLGCGRKGVGTITKTDTISVVRDTIVYVTDTFISYVPKSYKEEVIRDSIVYLERQPEYNDFPPIAKAWIEEYHTKKYYDTLIEHTSENGSMWNMRIKDTVYKNKIVGRGIWKYMEERVFTETITLREPPRIKGLIGLEVLGDITKPVQQTGVSFGLLMKNQSYYGIKGVLQHSGSTLYGIEYKRVIKLRK